MPRAAKKIQDDTTAQIFDALKKAFPELSDDPKKVVYRYNSVAVRVRVISPKFRGKSTAEREAMVNSAFDTLSSKICTTLSSGRSIRNAFRAPVSIRLVGLRLRGVDCASLFLMNAPVERSYVTPYGYTI